MSVFDPATIILNLMQRLGLNPAQVQQFYVRTVEWFNKADAELAAFKTGAAGMVAHYNARLDRIDFQLEQIRASLAALNVPLVINPDVPAQPINGKAIDHERPTATE